MFNFKKLKSNFNIGSNVFNNTFKQSPSLTNNNIVHKKVLYYDKKGNAPPVQFVKQVYSKLPDDEKVPVEFMTKKQYLKQYIYNQEKQDGIRFSKQEKQQYIRNELQDMRPIVSRFTTYHNPYMPPKVVFFTDSKINKQQFKHNAQHEFGHELYERVPKVRQQWNSTINKTSSPTSYGRTSVDEDFAESYALYKDKRLQDSRRQEVFNNIKVDQNSKNSQIYLGKDKIGKRTTAYVIDNKRNKIFMGSEAKDIDFNNDVNLNHLSGIIGHEELHNVLINDVNSYTSEKLDNISPPTIFLHGKKNEPTILAHIGNIPKEIIFSSEREKYAPVITSEHSVWLNDNNQIVKVDKISKNHLLKHESPNVLRRKVLFNYSTPEGVPISFETRGNNELEEYPTEDDVGYMLDTLPPGSIPSDTQIKFSPRAYTQQWGHREVKRKAKPETYANVIPEKTPEGKEYTVIRVFPVKGYRKPSIYPGFTPNDKFRKFREAFIHELGHAQDNVHNISGHFLVSGLGPRTAITNYGQRNLREDVAESFVHFNKVGGYFDREYLNRDNKVTANRMMVFEQTIPHTQLQSNPNVREIVENSLQSQTIKSHPTLTRSYEDLESDAKEKQHTYSPEELPFVDK